MLDQSKYTALPPKNVVESFIAADRVGQVHGGDHVLGDGTGSTDTGSSSSSSSSSSGRSSADPASLLDDIDVTKVEVSISLVWF